jgi:predicted RNA-binding Zn ribbon-like protein
VEGDCASALLQGRSEVMTERRPPAILIAGAPGLDFLNSIAQPTNTVIDWIDSGEGFLNWLGEVGLVPAEATEALRKQALPREFDKIADQARELREWFRGVVNQHKGRPLGLEAFAELAPLNHLLERDESYVQIAPRDHGSHGHFGVQSMRRWRSPESLLLPVGEALANFVCVEDFTDIKSCEGLSCTLMFIDHTRGRRRWCSMAICGNRTKQAAHRSRVKRQH